MTSPARRNHDGRIKVRLRFFLSCSPNARDRYLDAVRVATTHRPASKFGLDAEITAHDVGELARSMRGRTLYAYVGGRMHDGAGVCRHRNLAEYASRPTRSKLPVVLSPIEVHEAPRPLRN